MSAKLIYCETQFLKKEFSPKLIQIHAERKQETGKLLLWKLGNKFLSYLRIYILGVLPLDTYTKIKYCRQSKVWYNLWGKKQNLMSDTVRLYQYVFTPSIPIYFGFFLYIRAICKWRTPLPLTLAFIQIFLDRQKRMVEAKWQMLFCHAYISSLLSASVFFFHCQTFRQAQLGIKIIL